MVRVGFWYDYGIAYSGGLNYFRNLLYAISIANKNNIQPFVFFSTDIDKKIINEFSQYAIVVQTSVLTRNTLPWLIHRTLYKLFGSQFMVDTVLKKYGISVVSHASMVSGKKKPYRIILWIADFQYLHLPKFFPGLDVDRKTKQVKKIIEESDVVVLSSFDALNDFRSITPKKLAGKGRVLQFVSQPSSSYASKTTSNRTYLEQKHKFSGKYFFLPNQFWKHKNHHTVFEAVLLLKEKGKNIQIICTGWLSEHGRKKSDYISNLMDFFNKNDLQENIRILGSIDYIDVLSLARHSIAVINPSKFEGWSSSVEEAKSIGKPVILSNINVHIEQNPENGVFFDPNNKLELSNILEKAWDAWQDDVNPEIERKAREKLHARTLEFGEKYLQIIDELKL